MLVGVESGHVPSAKGNAITWFLSMACLPQSLNTCCIFFFFLGGTLFTREPSVPKSPIVHSKHLGGVFTVQRSRTRGSGGWRSVCKRAWRPARSSLLERREPGGTGCFRWLRMFSVRYCWTKIWEPGARINIWQPKVVFGTSLGQEGIEGKKEKRISNHGRSAASTPFSFVPYRQSFPSTFFSQKLIETFSPTYSLEIILVSSYINWRPPEKPLSTLCYSSLL